MTGSLHPFADPHPKPSPHLNPKSHEWVDEYVSPDGCGGPRSEQAEIIIDGQSGRIAECSQIAATVVAGGRLYLFTLLHERSDARAWFEAWVATIDLTPETAAVP